MCVCAWMCVFVYICVFSPGGINNQWHDMVVHRPCVIGQTCFMDFPIFGCLIRHALAVNKINKCGLSNSMH